jgi:hypothetical protein
MNAWLKKPMGQPGRNRSLATRHLHLQGGASVETARQNQVKSEPEGLPSAEPGASSTRRATTSVTYGWIKRKGQAVNGFLDRIERMGGL